ncbi:hypothetical protein CspHIS471_0100270 [Cutaneotrichosporon sp. HIS471]|nr:hypothetical protein CspHIS471_0100270 [Cutaneotrichosporon sp. HIS471]
MVHPNSINTTHVLNMIHNAWHLVDNARVITLLSLNPAPERIQDVNVLLPLLIEVIENMIASENYTVADVKKWHEAYSDGILAMRRAAKVAGHPIFPGHVYSFIIATGLDLKAEIATELAAGARKHVNDVSWVLFFEAVGGGATFAGLIEVQPQRKSAVRMK